MKKIATLKSPLFVHTTKSETQKGKFILNLNNYRNTFQMKLNKAKVVYKEGMKEQIMQLAPLQKVAVRFRLFPATRRLTDIPNVCCIHDKFFMDALVEYGKLPEDNYRCHIESDYVFGHVDKQDPRVEIEIFNV